MCQFFGNDTQILESSDPVLVLEGKYWRRYLDTIINEYKKWRKFALKKNKPIVPIARVNLCIIGFLHIRLLFKIV